MFEVKVSETDYNFVLNFLDNLIENDLAIEGKFIKANNLKYHTADSFKRMIIEKAFKTDDDGIDFVRLKLEDAEIADFYFLLGLVYQMLSKFNEKKICKFIKTDYIPMIGKRILIG